MKLKRFTFLAGLLLLILIFVRPSGAQAALKPSLIEDKVILYTDSEPYTFRFINLEKYPVVNGAKDALAYIKDFATKFAVSKSKQTKLEFRELTAGSEAFEAINKELNAYGSMRGVHCSV